MTVYAHHAALWHAIHAAHPGGRIVFACRLWIDYALLLVATEPPANVKLRCSACERETTREVDGRFDRSEVLELDANDDWLIEPTHGGEGT